MVRPPYLPEVWENDTDMKGLMSLPKAKHVNPINYKRVVDFWKDIITNYCKHEKTCLFTLDELKSKLRRGSQLPSPLATVIREMQESNLVQREVDFEKRNQGWVKWGLSFMQPSSWLAGSSAENGSQETFVELATLEHLSQNLLRFYRDQYEMVDCPEVVEYNQLKGSSAGIIDPRCFDLVISRLIELGEVSVGKSKRGDKVLKFKEQSSKGPAQFTDTDASVHDLRTTMHRLESEIKRLEERVTKFQEDARAVYRKGDKKSALALMKRKKLAEEEITTKDKQYQNLLQMLQQLAQTKQTKEIMSIYRESSAAFKAALKRQGLTAENVDMTMDNVNDIMHDIHDVEDALHNGLNNLPGHSSLNDSQLEEELNELLAENGEGPLAAPEGEQREAVQPPVPEPNGLEATNKVRVGKRVLDLMADFPDVPSDITENGNGAQRNAVAANGDSLEARWKRLRAE